MSIWQYDALPDYWWQNEDPDLEPEPDYNQQLSMDERPSCWLPLDINLLPEPSNHPY